ELVRRVTGDELTALAGIPLAAREGLYFPHLGWVVPPALCTALAQGVTRIQAEVERLDFDTQTRRWQLVDANGTAIASAPVVILACAQGLGRFAQTRHLPLRGIRGQISAVAVNDRSRMLKTVICGAGYLAPANDGLHTLGATYDLDDPDTGVRPGDHRRNLAPLATSRPAPPPLGPSPISSASQPRADGRRCAAPPPITCRWPALLPGPPNWWPPTPTSAATPGGIFPSPAPAGRACGSTAATAPGGSPTRPWRRS